MSDSSFTCPPGLLASGLVRRLFLPRHFSKFDLFFYYDSIPYFWFPTYNTHPSMYIYFFLHPKCVSCKPYYGMLNFLHQNMCIMQTLLRYTEFNENYSRNWYSVYSVSFLYRFVPDHHISSFLALRYSWNIAKVGIKHQSIDLLSCFSHIIHTLAHLFFLSFFQNEKFCIVITLLIMVDSANIHKFSSSFFLHFA